MRNLLNTSCAICKISVASREKNDRLADKKFRASVHATLVNIFAVLFGYVIIMCSLTPHRESKVLSRCKTPEFFACSFSLI